MMAMIRKVYWFFYLFTHPDLVWHVADIIAVCNSQKKVEKETRRFA